ncbi:centrosomal protein of 126 kDa isoform X2 [Eublepharis macularius]|uniref:Centrosomal protein of 126 kDa isoform X2 n=1 Tax=Eublepharis macularius TaxID=481883 RepID=A0AA97J2W2_EUBMA|nr:centrosomal protein of 126 kDa isoform X2 [Eublepharis macularius]
MEPSGGGGGNNVGYYSGFARVPAAAAAAAAGLQAEAKAAAVAAEARPATQGWKRSPSDSALSRGPSRRAWSAFAPSTNLKLFLERDLSKERQELLKDQRQFHNRARKHSLETNKRRRALEEKWKKEEEKEQRFREQILLQRKLKLQEATEKFQRGHLPYSQRKRVQRKPESTLDEAFEKIQVTGLQLPLYRCNGRTTDTVSSAIRNGPFLWKQTAKTGSDRITEENDRASLDRGQLLFQQNLEEMQQQLQEQHFSNLQSFHREVNEITNSESIGSVDSLEAGEQIESFATPTEASAQLDSTLYTSQESQARNKSVSDYINMTFSKNQHVNNWLINLNTSNIQRASPFHDMLIKYNVLNPEEEACNPAQKPPLLSTSEQKESERCTSDDDLAFMQNKRGEKCSLLKNPSSGPISTEDRVAADKLAPKFNQVWATSDPSPVALEQEKNSEGLQNNRTLLAQPSNPIAATPVAFPTGQWSSTAPYNNGFLVNCWQKGKDAHAARCTEDIDCATGAEMEKYFSHTNNEASLVEEVRKSSLDQQNDKGKEKTSDIILSVPSRDCAANLSDRDHQWNNNANEIKGVKFPKSILKKESKYEPNASFKALVVNRGIRFGIQSVSSIRDSVELAKTKGKDVDIQKNYKKLRWFDEINRTEETNDNEKCSEQSIIEIPRAPSHSSGFPIKATTSRTNLRSVPSCNMNSTLVENWQDNSETSTKIAASGGSERVYDTLNPFESTRYRIAKEAWMAPKGEEIKPSPCVDLKNPKGNPRKSRAKMIKRPKSAKVPSTFTPRNRKGTIIRPQSASEATNVMKTQGKIMVPHPPYKSVGGKSTDQNGSSLLNEDQDLNRDTTEGPSPHMGTGSLSEPPPSTHDPLTKTSHMANTTQSTAQHDNAIKRSPGYSENGLCLDHTPSDEEIELACQGVHTVQTQKDGAAGAVARRKYSNDNSENKRKALLEQRRQMTASAGWKPSYFGQNSTQTMKSGPLSSASEPVHAMGSVSHSDEANAAAAEGEILTCVDPAQQYKPTVVLNRPLRPGMSALSLEEYKVLQSLDRLNQRLQNVQETMNKNPSSTSILQTIAPLVTSPSYVDTMPSIQRCKSILADARTLTQRRY